MRPYCENRNGTVYLGTYCQLDQPVIDCRQSSIGIELQLEKDKIGYYGDYLVGDNLVEPQHDPGKPDLNILNEYYSVRCHKCFY